MRINHFIICLSVFTLLCFTAGLSAKDVPGNVADKVKELTNSKPPAETPSGTQPAEPANPGQNPAKPAEPGNPGKPEPPSKPETPPEPSKPADPVKNGNPPEQTPSGTQPAEPANPAENPAEPAAPAKPGENPAEPAGPGDKGQPEDADKGQEDEDNKDAKDKKDKTEKDSKNKKDKPGKGGKSGGGPSAPSLPSGVPTPQSAGASLLPAAGAAGGIIGGIFSGGKKKAKEEKKEIPKPAAKATAVSSETAKAATSVQASTETAKAAVPGQAVGIASGTVQASTRAVVAEPLYSAGKGPRIAVMAFDGEAGAEFSALLSKILSADFKVYNPKELAAKEYDTAAINRVSARKIAAETAVEYIVTGKVSKKSGTLSIISVFLRDGKTGDIKMTANHSLRSAEDLKSAAETASGKIKERIK